MSLIRALCRRGFYFGREKTKMEKQFIKGSSFSWEPRDPYMAKLENESILPFHCSPYPTLPLLPLSYYHSAKGKKLSLFSPGFEGARQNRWEVSRAAILWKHKTDSENPHVKNLIVKPSWVNPCNSSFMSCVPKRKKKKERKRKGWSLNPVSTPVPQHVSSFGDRVFTDVIKFKWGP